MIRIIIGMIVLLGVAGSDCDGKCVADSMSISEMLSWAAVGLSLIIRPVAGVIINEKKGN
jgi:uncharacterized membrane protein